MTSNKKYSTAHIIPHITRHASRLCEPITSPFSFSTRVFLIIFFTFSTAQAAEKKKKKKEKKVQSTREKCKGLGRYFEIKIKINWLRDYDLEKKERKHAEVEINKK